LPSWRITHPSRPGHILLWLKISNGYAFVAGEASSWAVVKGSSALRRAVLDHLPAISAGASGLVGDGQGVGEGVLGERIRVELPVELQNCGDKAGPGVVRD
jgi:hypothetical protein